MTIVSAVLILKSGIVGNPSFRVIGCTNENAFLVYLLCHFDVTNLVDENAVARGFHLGVFNFCFLKVDGKSGSSGVRCVSILETFKTF